MRILLGILTAEKNLSRRSGIRQTWLPMAQSANVDAMFVFGFGHKGPPIPLHIDDYLITNAIDLYIHLSPKVQIFCQWAIEQDWDYVMKTDDDSYIVPERLCQIAQEHQGQDCIGSIVMPENPYMTGSGYLLSRRAAAVIADRVMIGQEMVAHPFLSEDRIISHTLKTAGFQLVNEPRLCHTITEVSRPLPNNDIALTHLVTTPEMMHEVHRSFLG